MKKSERSSLQQRLWIFTAVVDRILWQSIIDDVCGVISPTATPAKSAVVLLAWSKKRSMSNRVKLPLDADVEAVLSLSLLIVRNARKPISNPAQL